MKKLRYVSPVIEYIELEEAGIIATSGFGGGNYQSAPKPEPSAAIGDGFMNIPEGIDEELPFS